VVGGQESPVTLACVPFPFCQADAPPGDYGRTMQRKPRWEVDVSTG